MTHWFETNITHSSNTKITKLSVYETCIGASNMRVNIVLWVSGLFHFEARTVPGQFQDGVLWCKLNLGHDGTVVHVKNENTAIRSPQIHLHSGRCNSIICLAKAFHRLFGNSLNIEFSMILQVSLGLVRMVADILAGHLVSMFRWLSLLLGLKRLTSIVVQRLNRRVQNRPTNIQHILKHSEWVKFRKKSFLTPIYNSAMLSILIILPSSRCIIELPTFWNGSTFNEYLLGSGAGGISGSNRFSKIWS